VIATGPEIRRGLEGALAILRREPAAMAFFDLSFEGFLRSFSAALLAFPAYLVLVLHSLPDGPATLAFPLFLLVETGGYLAGWLAFPLAAALVLRAMGESRRFVPLVVANNWAALLQIHFLLAAVLLAAVLPQPTGAVLVTGATLAALAYQWLVVKTALEAPGQVAAGFVLLDVVASMLVNAGTDRLLAWLAAPALLEPAALG
jgi:biotin transporter BioY